MLSSIFLSILLVALYVGAAIWSYRGLPVSISSLVYLLPEGGSRWLWTLWLLAVNLLTLAPAIQILDARGLAFLGFLPMALLGFVAVWPVFDRDHYRLHNIFGTAAAVMTQVIVVLVYPDWLFAWALFVFLMGSVLVQPKDGDMRQVFKGKGVFVAESVCYIALVGAELTWLIVR